MSKKKKSIAALKAAIAEHEYKSDNAPTSAVQQLVEAYLSTDNPKKRAKRIARIKEQCDGINEMLTENSELLTAEVEQALLRAATGYAVTERRVRLANGIKTVETVEKHIPPSQAAIEFYLTNKSDDYSNGEKNSGDDRINDLLIALKK